MQRILVLEDDADLRLEIEETLEDEFQVEGCGTLRAFWAAFEDMQPALAVLDLGLPDGRGSDVIRQIRERTNTVGIVVLSGQNSEFERIVALEMGADDFVVKPCSARELLARIHATLRRVNSSKADTYIAEIAQFGDYSVNLVEKEMFNANGTPMNLTSAEFELLRVLVKHPQRVLSRSQIVEHLRGDGWTGYDRSIDSLVYRLRKKLRSEHHPNAYLKTVHGSGYIFTPEVTFCQ